MLTAPRSPWQNPYVEGLTGSIRRECLDHVIVLNERSLQRILRSYVDYYHRVRTHLVLWNRIHRHYLAALLYSCFAGRSAGGRRRRLFSRQRKHL